MRIPPTMHAALRAAIPRPATRCAFLRHTPALRYSTATAPAATHSTPTPTPARAAALAAAEATTEADSAQPSPGGAFPTNAPSAKTTQPSISSTSGTSHRVPLTPPRYHVSRTKTKNLPIYTDYKRGGNLHLTTVRRITGDSAALRDELRVWLGKSDADINVNSLTGHVVIKGHRVADVSSFLTARGM